MREVIRKEKECFRNGICENYVTMKNVQKQNVKAPGTLCLPLRTAEGPYILPVFLAAVHVVADALAGDEEKDKGAPPLLFRLRPSTFDRLVVIAHYFDVFNEKIKSCVFAELMELVDFMGHQHVDRRGTKRVRQHPVLPPPPSGGAVPAIGQPENTVTQYLRSILEDDWVNKADQMSELLYAQIFVESVCRNPRGPEATKHGIVTDCNDCDTIYQPKVWQRKRAYLERREGGSTQRARFMTPGMSEAERYRLRRDVVRTGCGIRARMYPVPKVGSRKYRDNHH